MTYQELLDRLKELSPEQLRAEVLYQDTNDGEYYGIEGINTNGADYGFDDDSQPVLRIQQ